MTTRKNSFYQVGLAAALMLMVSPIRAQMGPLCGGRNACAEVTPFLATINDFRTSTAGRYKVITTSIRFQNKTNRPLILGYVSGSGVAIDDQGNRYGASTVRGIGEISGRNADSKFVLQPGEASDGRFELLWEPTRGVVFGLTFELELTIREIVPLPANQIRLGPEHALHFKALANNVSFNAPGQAAPAAPHMPAPAPTSVPQPTPAPAVAVPAAPAVDACAGLAHCYNAGSFIAEVRSVIPSNESRYHVVRLNVRIRNVSGEQLILGYKAGTSTVIDNMGQRYYWGRAGTYDTSVTGIGVVQGNKADPQFVLNPGQSREATFRLFRNQAPNGGVGSAYNFDVALEQLAVLQSQQIQTVREYSLNFPNLPLAGMAAAPAQSVSEATKALKDIFKKKR
ncbi:hypothetical protein [uncultured Paludibaculum sp.]|uniref:hypothetical protein n=1 Tax=uncultured Paludibaculum sp. TaxID=1765020 RepID=UPI002AAB64FC|nr:hypothetical protein [uncultured Paludibaculum sp.]